MFLNSFCFNLFLKWFPYSTFDILSWPSIWSACWSILMISFHIHWKKERKKERKEERKKVERVRSMQVHFFDPKEFEQFSNPLFLAFQFSFQSLITYSSINFKGSNFCFFQNILTQNLVVVTSLSNPLWTQKTRHKYK